MPGPSPGIDARLAHHQPRHAGQRPSSCASFCFPFSTLAGSPGKRGGGLCVVSSRLCAGHNSGFGGIKCHGNRRHISDIVGPWPAHRAETGLVETSTSFQSTSQTLTWR
jgi:hypothetical protein